MGRAGNHLPGHCQCGRPRGPQRPAKISRRIHPPDLGRVPPRLVGPVQETHQVPVPPRPLGRPPARRHLRPRRQVLHPGAFQRQPCRADSLLGCLMRHYATRCCHFVRIARVETRAYGHAAANAAANRLQTACAALPRSLDVLHVAAALECGCVGFASFDERQRKIAALAGSESKPWKDRNLIRPAGGSAAGSRDGTRLCRSSCR